MNLLWKLLLRLGPFDLERRGDEHAALIGLRLYGSHKTCAYKT
jgi:hypothetical protein